MAPKLSSHLGRNAYICHSCRHRTFTSTRAQLAIAPESPRYIDIPTPPQQTVTPAPSHKGIIPVPRDVIRRGPKFGGLGASGEKKRPEPVPSDARLAFKRAQSELRKQNLREGWRALSHRRGARIGRAKAESFRKRSERQAALTAPVRTVDRLTAATLDPSVVLEMQRLQAKGAAAGAEREKLRQKREEVAARRRARFERREEKLAEVRRDALHELYMNARTFVVDEEGLSKAIDEAFGTDDRPKTFPHNKASWWGAGPPPHMGDLGITEWRHNDGGARMRGLHVLKERLKKMGEQVTGGKMDGTA